MSARCPECGGVLATWHRAAILDACRAWVERHGEPPTGRKWARASAVNPANTTVREVFGSWNAMIEAAGFAPRQPVRSRVWSRAEVLHAFTVWAFEHGGDMPRYQDWGPRRDLRFPPSESVVSLFGSWNAGVVAAGYEPRVKHRTVDAYRRQAGAVARHRDVAA